MENAEAVRLLNALAQNTRLSLFRLLVRAGPEGLTVGRIAGHLGVANATLSFHLKELAHAGLVVTRQQGRFVQCSADFGRMRALLGFLTENCCAGAPCGVESLDMDCAPGAAKEPSRP